MSHFECWWVSASLDEIIIVFESRVIHEWNSPMCGSLEFVSQPALTLIRRAFLSLRGPSYCWADKFLC